MKKFSPVAGECRFLHKWFLYLFILVGISGKLFAVPVHKELDCLLVFANTTDWNFPAQKKIDVENVLFNNTENVSDATLASTFGNYSYRHGNDNGKPGTITIDLATAAGAMAGDLNPDNGTDRQAYLDGIQGLGYDISTYDRILLFAPQGYVVGDSFAQASTPGSMSVYGYSVFGNRLFYYLMHEMSHNLGLNHSGVGTNSYADKSCAMGVYWDGLNRSPCFNAPTIVEGGFLNDHPGSVSILSTNTTLDIYPIGIDPTQTPGVRVVQIGDQQLFVSYIRNILPYSYLADTSLHDKVVIHEQVKLTDPTSIHSDRKSVLSVGSSYSWNSVTITFNSYGPNNDYANISVDMPSTGNAPTANSQSLTTGFNQAVSFVLTGSDPESDALYYRVTAQPMNGWVTGTVPNLTYTPNAGFTGTDTFTFSVSDLVGTDTAQLTIDVQNNKPTVSIFPNPAVLGEGSGLWGQWIIQRTGPTTEPLAIQYQIEGTATFGADYTITNGMLASGTRYISTGQSSNAIYFFPIDDAISEGLETATFKILASPNYNIAVGSAEATITIEDDEAGSPINEVDLPAGIALYGYTGETPIDAQAAFQGLIDANQLSLVRWVNPATGQIKELYYTTFPSAGWINEIGNLTLGQGYVVKTSQACTLSISGNKDTSSVTHNLPAGYSIIGFNKETPVDALTAFQSLVTAGKLELVRWVDPSNGSIKELYYTTFPSAGWVNEIGSLTEGQGYIIKLNAPHSGFQLP